VQSALLDPFWSPILHGIESEAQQRRLQFVYRGRVGPNQLDVDKICVELSANNHCGVLLVGPAPIEYLQAFKRTAAPLVLIDHHVPHQGVDAVLGDNFDGARMAVAHLIVAGHQQIAMIGGPTVWQPGPVNLIYTLEQRMAGYRAALLEAGLPLDERLYVASDLTSESGYRAATELLARDVNFTGLFCGNDLAAIGAIKALAEHNRRVPEDVSVVGFDDIDIAQHLTPALSTVRLHKEAMGRLAVQRLLDRANDVTLMPVLQTLDVDFIARESVMPPNPSRQHA
ncbi:MAG: substrate-binding domain-containing protein, partial [Chloroflexales bacterium]|nr:substrate-binding domain-containing protein [Chloroflexales bacterium]